MHVFVFQKKVNNKYNSCCAYKKEKQIYTYIWYRTEWGKEQKKKMYSEYKNLHSVSPAFLFFVLASPEITKEEKQLKKKNKSGEKIHPLFSHWNNRSSKLYILFTPPKFNLIKIKRKNVLLKKKHLTFPNVSLFFYKR